MAFHRIKIINGNAYVYLVKNTWMPKIKAPRQKVLAYIGKFHVKGIMTPKIIRTVYERDNYECQECHTRAGLEIDHVQPILKGGSNLPENLRVLCSNCNKVKSNKTNLH